MTELYHSAPPFGGSALITWLEALGDPVAAMRRPNDPLPQRVVHRIGGPADLITDSGVYSIHDFAETFTGAEDAATLTFRRLAALGPPYSGQRSITMPDGRTVQVDGVEVQEFPHEEYYSDSLVRFVGRYRIPFRFVTA